MKTVTEAEARLEEAEDKNENTTRERFELAKARALISEVIVKQKQKELEEVGGILLEWTKKDLEKAEKQLTTLKEVLKLYSELTKAEKQLTTLREVSKLYSELIKAEAAEEQAKEKLKKAKEEDRDITEKTLELTEAVLTVVDLRIKIKEEELECEEGVKRELIEKELEEATKTKKELEETKLYYELRIAEKEEAKLRLELEEVTKY